MSYFLSVPFLPVPFLSLYSLLFPVISASLPLTLNLSLELGRALSVSEEPFAHILAG